MVGDCPFLPSFLSAKTSSIKLSHLQPPTIAAPAALRIHPPSALLALSLSLPFSFSVPFTFLLLYRHTSCCPLFLPSTLSIETANIPGALTVLSRQPPVLSPCRLPVFFARLVRRSLFAALLHFVSYLLSFLHYPLCSFFIRLCRLFCLFCDRQHPPGISTNFLTSKGPRRLHSPIGPLRRTTPPRKETVYEVEA